MKQLVQPNADSSYDNDITAVVAAKDDDSAFKRAHARYRKRPDDPGRLDDMHEIIDFSRPTTTTDRGMMADTTGSNNHTSSAGGCAVRVLRHSLSITTTNVSNSDYYYTGPVFGLEEFPGFFVMPQALSQSLQQRLAYAAVTDYCEGSHATNIDTIPPKPLEIVNHSTCSMETNESMWALWKRELRNNDAACDTKQRGQRRGNTEASGSSLSTNKTAYYRCFRKLSWATTGYHYDWTRRCYHEQAKSLMPMELQRLGQLFAHTAFLLSQPAVAAADDENELNRQFSYTASASIVNYYNYKSVMGGHRDDLELALDKPIVSCSMGQAAVFLLGGTTKQEEPVVPIVVRPGDVMILGGDCRLCYHSMCRLVPTHDLPLVDPTCCPEPEQQVSVEQIFSNNTTVEQTPLANPIECEALVKFLTDHRINLNLRQVYPDE